jgi:hypothetical protein
MSTEAGKKIREGYIKEFEDSPRFENEEIKKLFIEDMDAQLKIALSNRYLLEQNLNLLSQIEQKDSPVHDKSSVERKALEYGITCAMDSTGDFQGTQSRGVTVERGICYPFSFSFSASHHSKEVIASQKNKALQAGKALVASFVDGVEFDTSTLSVAGTTAESINNAAAKAIKPYISENNNYINLSKEQRINDSKKQFEKFSEDTAFNKEWGKKFDEIIKQEEELDAKYE